LINNEGIEQVARLVLAFVVDVADSDRAFKFRQQSRSEDPAGRRAFEQPLASPGPRFGLEWRDAKADEKGVVVTKVTPGLPAAKAGLRVGDRIVKFNGHEVTSELPLRMAVLAAVSPVELEILRGEMPEPTKLQVHLLGSPTRLGIAWRDDSAEPGTVMLTQVVPGSAAYAAGLKERDRICEVGGKRFQGSKEFHELATTLPGPLEVQVERAGRLYKLTLELPK
jgi:S1-C subfamily serine protease